jgi:hypothetical protein
MKKVKFFIKKGCGPCSLTKEIGDLLKREFEDSVKIEYFDLMDVDNMAEGLFYGIEKTPSVIIESKDGSFERILWEGRTLTHRSIKKALENENT